MILSTALLSIYRYLQRYKSRSTTQGVPPVVASGGLGHVIPSNNKTQLIQCTNMLVIVDFGGNAMSYLCARSKARELKALHSQFGMLFGAMRLLPQTRQLFCYSKVAWVDTPRVSTPRLDILRTRCGSHSLLQGVVRNVPIGSWLCCAPREGGLHPKVQCYPVLPGPLLPQKKFSQLSFVPFHWLQQ